MRTAGELERQDHGASTELFWTDGRGEPLQLPGWAAWLVATGTLLAVEPSAHGHRRTVVVTVPDRRFAAALIAHGITTAFAAGRAADATADVAARFLGAVPGETRITWIDSNCESRFGRFCGIEDDIISYVGRVHSGWGARSTRPLDFASTFWPAADEDEFVGGRPIARSVGFLSCATGVPAEQYAASSDIDTIMVGTRTELVADLSDMCFSAGGHTGCLLDTVRPRHVVSLGQRHRSAILSATAAPGDTIGSSCHGPAVLDGGGAYLRHRDSVDTHTQIVVLDRWHPRSEEAAETALVERNETWIEAPIPNLGAAPAGVEIFAWTEEW